MTDATSRLTFALGRDVSGKPYAVDLARMPHLLIAGATGSGKSVCVNAIITSILMRATPDEVRFVLVDLKRVELAPYGGIPHLLAPVVMEAYQARAALNWAVNEMEERYKKLAASAERNITAYNASDRVSPAERLPFIVLIIDELADLMIREGRKVEDPVVKLAQKARAVGIHLVLATQRPSVNVVTGLIKANVPEPDRVRDGLERRQPDGPRRAGRRGPHRPGRHALPAGGPAAAGAAPGRVRVGRRGPRGRRSLARPGARALLRRRGPRGHR